MPTIQADNVYARLFGSETDIVKAEKVCSWTTKQKSTRYLSKRQGDNCVVFPAGLVRRVVKATGATVTDMRTAPEWGWDLSKATWLRDYQVEALKTLTKRTRCLFRSPTGSGKGEIVAAAIACSPGARWLVLTPRVSLVNDLKGRLEARAGVTAVPLGVPFTRPGVRIATYAAAALMAKENPQVFLDFDAIICDEAHSIAAASYYQAIRLCRKAYWRMGLSATPTERTDGKAIYVVGVFGDPVTLAEYDELVEEGSITDYEVVWRKVQGIPADPFESFAVSYDRCIVRNPERNRVLAEDALGCEKPAMLFLERVNHAKGVYRKLQESGVKVALATKDTSKAVRESIIHGARQGLIDVIVATRVFAEGVDIPGIRTVINGAGLKAPIALLQRIGRGSRLAQGKHKFTVYEYEESVGFGKRHAAERKKVLAEHHGK